MHEITFMDLSKTIYNISSIQRKMKGVSRQKMHLFSKGANVLDAKELKQLNTIIDSEYKAFKAVINNMGK